MDKRKKNTFEITLKNENETGSRISENIHLKQRWGTYGKKVLGFWPHKCTRWKKIENQTSNGYYSRNNLRYLSQNCVIQFELKSLSRVYIKI